MEDIGNQTVPSGSGKGDCTKDYLTSVPRIDYKKPTTSCDNLKRGSAADKRWHC